MSYITKRSLRTNSVDDGKMSWNSPEMLEVLLGQYKSKCQWPGACLIPQWKNILNQKSYRAILTLPVNSAMFLQDGHKLEISALLLALIWLDHSCIFEMLYLFKY